MFQERKTSLELSQELQADQALRLVELAVGVDQLPVGQVVVPED